jgi:hypothetical protein
MFGHDRNRTILTEIRSECVEAEHGSIGRDLVASVSVCLVDSALDPDRKTASFGHGIARVQNSRRSSCVGIDLPKAVARSVSSAVAPAIVRWKISETSVISALRSEARDPTVLNARGREGAR